MNAYELAKALKDYYEEVSEEFSGFGFLRESASLISQQADQLDKVIPQLVKANGLIENLRIRIAELEKFIKAILKKGGCDGNICKRYSTHPVKQLSDEEIDTIYYKTLNRFDFARAIIKEITK